MDDSYPTLKGPKKKLVYPVATTGGLDQWAKDINTLEDVDKMFDDLDSKIEDFPLPPPEIHIPKKDKHIERDVTPFSPPMMVIGGQKQAQHTPLIPRLCTDSDTPFKAHRPVYTSSPLAGNVKQHENRGQKEDNSVSPILFDCEDENPDLKTADSPTRKHQHSSEGAESDSSFFETLPNKSNKMSAQKMVTVPARTKPSSLPATPVKINELKGAAPEKLSAKIKPDMTSFIQKLKDSKQHKSTLAGVSKAKALCPLPEPEPEDDFLILEEDRPFRVSIPNKYSKSKREKEIKKSFTEATGTAGEEHSPENQQDIVKDNRQQESQSLADKPNSVASVENHPTVESDHLQSVLPFGLVKGKRRPAKKLLSDHEDEPENTATERDEGTLSKKLVKEKKTVKKGSKPLKKNKGNSQKDMTPAKENRKAESSTNAVEVQNMKLSLETQLDNEPPVLEVNSVQSEATVDPADIESGPKIEKRRRKPPGEWWIRSSQSSEPQATENKTKKNKESPSSVKAATGGRKENLKPTSSSDGVKTKVVKRKLKRKEPAEVPLTVESDQVSYQPTQDRALNQDSNSDSSPFLFAHRENSESTGTFQKVYQNTAKKSSSSDRASPTRPEGTQCLEEMSKRRRKSHGNWWQVNPTAEDQDMALQSDVQKLPNNKKNKLAGKKKKQAEKLMAHSPLKPLEGALTTKDCISTVVERPPVTKKNVATLKRKSKVISPPAEATEVGDDVVVIQRNEQELSPSQSTAQESMSKIIRSGPSSMIVYENFDEGDNIDVSPTTMQPVLCVSDLCCPPLRPLILQPKDEVNLQDWLKFLWPTVNKKPEITPDDFKWYCHRGKAMGILVDLETASICTGKMLLGSSMKKPLWVDHSATTVFNLLTGSVSVVVDCSKSLYNAGQSFMVPPGHAYSIHNVNAQPAVLYFTRVFTEDSDE